MPDDPLETRHGTDMDQAELERILHSIGYQIRNEKNLTHIEILNCVADVVSDSAEYDSVVVCIMSHGLNGTYYSAVFSPSLRILSINSFVITYFQNRLRLWCQ